MERIVLPVDMEAGSTDGENTAGGAKEAILTQIEKEDNSWDKDPENPLNWGPRAKFIQIAMLSSATFLGSVATSIVSPSVAYVMLEFSVSRTVAILCLALYVLALAFGPVIGGPLSETIGRRYVYIGCILTGVLFTVGASQATNFVTLCILRFFSGFCWGPTLAVTAGSIIEVFRAEARGPVSAIIVLMAFLGPGLGPVIGAFAVSRHGWRWPYYCLLVVSAAPLTLSILSKETFHPLLRRRLAKSRGEPVSPSQPLSVRLREFALVAVVRPVRMLVLEPIVTFICLYVALGFGTLFSFFAAVPYTFTSVYRFDVEQCGLVFLSVVIGCFLGLITIVLCDKLIYQKKVNQFPPNKVPPEHRLYAAMVGSLVLPIGLFWFGWSARAGVSWASPAAAISFFAWGNISIFITTFQYKTDTYTGNVIASAASANSLARYGFAAAFPLFTVQMYQKLGIPWASSLLGFFSLVLLPVPWVLFKYGPRIRAKSQYETVQYS
ncbi:unnamed protein product [Clonostachys rosea f. rosea IK726]|uniref:Major facilitator superfamily (MFS) profile domain-containing protein n=2 Tax=Bionectria ochroleuca TaxID=29856 RepID=A0A0B7K4E6_BIOOC|nr:unnamed protein product [Clonostachys rosea f. rosea IK726]